MESIEIHNYKFICFTDAGCNLMLKVVKSLVVNIEKPGKEISEIEDAIIPNKLHDLKSFIEKSFKTGNILVFIGAMGIAVRSIAPFIKDKTTDPAVIVIDEKGEFVIPVLSGHIGGAVDAARTIAAQIGATPVVTTATDVEGLFAVDVFACKNGMFISDMKKAKEFSAKLINNKTASYYVDEQYLHIDNFPPELKRDTGVFDAPDMIITPEKTNGDILQLIPKCIVVGMGCKRETAGDKLYAFCAECLDKAGLDIHSVKAIVSADIKSEEPGLQDLSKWLDADFITFSSATLMEQEGEFSSSDFVKSVTGADNICERAVIAYGCHKLLVKKTARDGMTFACGIRV